MLKQKSGEKLLDCKIQYRWDGGKLRLWRACKTTSIFESVAVLVEAGTDGREAI